MEKQNKKISLGRLYSRSKLTHKPRWWCLKWKMNHVPWRKLPMQCHSCSAVTTTQILPEFSGSELTLCCRRVSGHFTEEVGFHWYPEYVWILVRGQFWQEFQSLKGNVFHKETEGRSEAGAFWKIGLARGEGQYWGEVGNYFGQGDRTQTEQALANKQI